MSRLLPVILLGAVLLLPFMEANAQQSNRPVQTCEYLGKPEVYIVRADLPKEFAEKKCDLKTAVSGFMCMGIVRCAEGEGMAYCKAKQTSRRCRPDLGEKCIGDRLVYLCPPADACAREENIERVKAEVDDYYEPMNTKKSGRTNAITR